MMPTTAGPGSRAASWLLAVAGLLLLWSCSDLLHDPAPPSNMQPLALRLSSAASPGGPNASISEAFERADLARVRVVRGESVEGGLVIDTVFAFDPQGEQARLRLNVDAALASEPLFILVQLRTGEAILFEGSSAVTLQGSGTTSAEVTLEPVVARVDAGADPPPITAIGAGLQLTGEALFATDDVVTGIQLTWQALDPGVVEVSPQGEVVALTEGAARVEGAHGAHTDTVLVRVAQAAASVSIDPASVALRRGQSQQFTAEVQDSNGNPAEGQPIAWSSSDPEIVTIDAETGLAQAMAAGTATITAAAGEVSGTATVSVDNPGPVLDALDPSSALAGSEGVTMTVVGSGFLRASEVHWDGAPRPTEFASAQQLRVTIPAADLAEAGPVAVTVVNPAPGGGASEAQTFMVVEAVSSVTITPPSVTLLPEETQQFTVTVLDGNGNTVEDPLIAWSSSDPEIVAIDAESGLARAVMAGTATITAAAEEGSGTATVSVVNPEPVLNTLDPGSAIAGAQGIAIAVGGSGFVPTSQVHWDGAPRPTEFASAEQLRVTIPAADLAEAGPVAVTVVNPAPGGGASEAQTFMIEPAPVLELDPTSIEFAMVLGEGAPPPQTVSVTNGGGGTLGPVRYEIVYISGREWLDVTPTELTAPGTFTLTAAAEGHAPGVYEVEVRVSVPNASNGNQILPVTFTIEDTPPAAPAELVVVRAGLLPTLRWLDGSDNEDGFVIERWDGEAGPWTEVGTVDPNETTFVDVPLEWGETYRYRVHAFNSGGASEPTNEVDVVVQDPAAVDTQEPEAVTYASATLQGVVSGNGLGYDYRFGWQSDDLEYSDSTEWESSGNCDPAFECLWLADLGNLYGDREYYYWLEAENELGLVVGDTVFFQTQQAVPPMAQSGTANVDVPNSVTLQYFVSPNGDDFISWVELSFTEDMTEVVRMSQPMTSNLRERLGTEGLWEFFAEVVDLPSGTTYYWRPVVQNFSEETRFGQVQSFTTASLPGN